MPTNAHIRATIYVEEAVGYFADENSKELQTAECEKFCHHHGIEIYNPPLNPTAPRDSQKRDTHGRPFQQRSS